MAFESFNCYIELVGYDLLYTIPDFCHLAFALELSIYSIITALHVFFIVPSTSPSGVVLGDILSVSYCTRQNVHKMNNPIPQ